jgi:DNA sulfur modification protein DndD
MIIKEIIIKNFRSYYGENKFEFSDGLTLIIGDNGDGKTTFFDALQWLFNTTVENNSIDNASEMRKSKLEIGESDEVFVSMSFEHDGMKLVEKRFSFERISETNFKTTPIIFRGYELNGTEREVVNGKNLMDRCFDAFIQRFSMFKGESELNVFDSSTALKELVDKFSDVRKFDELVTMSSSMEEKANKAYLKECSSDKKIAGEAKLLELQLKRVSEDIYNKKKEINDKKMSVTTFTSKLEELEKNQETTERYKEVSDRLKNLNDKASKMRGMIATVDKNTALLDKLWILCAFPEILNSFKSKSSAFSKEKRKQDNDFIKQKAKEQGKIEAIDEICGALEGGATKLPWYLPDQATMEEMINDHVCKVCGRPAPEGSDAYKFMVEKLNEYKEHAAAKARAEQEKEAIEKKELFSGRYVEEIHNLSIRLSGAEEAKIANIKTEISDRLDLEERLKRELDELQVKIQDAQDDKARLLIQAGNVSEEILQKTFTDIKGMFEQKGRAEKRLVELEGELKVLKEKESKLQEKFDELNPQSGQVKVYREVHHVLEAIAKAFRNAKAENLRRFLGALEDRANDYLEKLSANDFHGEIRLRQTADESTEIRLYSSNDAEIKNPSGSQKTVMYMSVLFAISDFTDEKRDENYPLIFDAATSSFGDSKEEKFYNVIDKLNKQCIIITKDFISKGQLRLNEIDELTCGVYRIKKAPNFDDRNMATIRTLVEKIK